jgi:hypothetical protein
LPGNKDFYSTPSETLQYFSGYELQNLATPAEFVNAVEDGFGYRGRGQPATEPSRIVGDDALVTSYTAIFPE